ncbi:protein-methionine-sulfoxide reductase catalytic subunit MsrP [Methyloraptor flagellatus]|uniref:Protein-methionine-sulfoxide reductase catalytic subunit MsrP n=1 Tax=Methyloraptor flagellatus TaxID=3162530 RepID=A0AAU7XB28_9HYPH
MVSFIRRRPWEIRESAATPEALFFDRRQVLAGLGGAVAAGGLIGAGAIGSSRAAFAAGGPIDDLFPPKRNEAFKLDRALTPEAANGSYNNFYEFGFDKGIADRAAKLKPFPWSVTIDGLCNKPQKLDAVELIRKMPIEERLYRHRCVEAWSMTIPWTGFPLAELVKLADPKPEAKYLRMETFLDPKIAVMQAQTWYPWPYVEGLTLAEATNDLAFIAIGAYGKPLPNQHGAPLRLSVPWKYGFKSIKSIVKFSFVKERPKSYWEGLQASEYGFWANVNPAVPHPRWSQATERVLGTPDTVPTQIYNGYGEQVAGLYKDLAGERLFM